MLTSAMTPTRHPTVSLCLATEARAYWYARARVRAPTSQLIRELRNYEVVNLDDLVSVL